MCTDAPLALNTRQKHVCKLHHEQQAQRLHSWGCKSMLCGNGAAHTSHTIYIRDPVDLDAAQTRESAPAGVKGLRGGGGQARIKLTAIYSLSGTNQSTSKAQDGPLALRKQYNRLVAHAGRHSSHRALPLGEHSGYSVYHCGDLR